MEAVTRSCTPTLGALQVEHRSDRIHYKALIDTEGKGIHKGSYHGRSTVGVTAA